MSSEDSDTDNWLEDEYEGDSDESASSNDEISSESSDSDIDVDMSSFLDDGTVEAVPSTWLQGGVCRWPTCATEKLRAAIRKCEPLNTCWPTHNVKIFRNSTFDDYMKARSKAKLAEETSDLNTGDETETHSSKRRRIQKVLSSSEDSLNESLLSPPPNIKIYSKRSGKIFKETQNFASTQINENIAPNCGTQERNDFEQPSTSGINVQCGKCDEKDKNFKLLLQQNHILRGIITDTLQEVKEIKKILVERGHSMERPKEKLFFKSPGINFPINSDEEFQRLEDILQDEEFFENSALELSELGGTSTYD
ncbi:hypothetical protein FQR65_LT19309 [Abscondita terminalis]|nr:hypothetical protein FQR65_LT19309 [Abscondita terminalis]